MYFLIRTAFWLSLVVALIPVNPADLRPDQRPVSTLETISIARTVMADAAGFCDRNPEACATGRELISQFGVKARNGWAFANRLFGVDETDVDAQQAKDRTKTGSITR
jgi:hypothetical protein